MIQLTILHINDLHGRVEQLLRIATLVRRIRKQVQAAGGYCLFLDGGDSEDTTLLESSLTKGSAMEAILRGAGCDYVVLGNAVPVRYGHQAIANLAKSFGRPLLCANLFDAHGERISGLAPFVVEQFGDARVGIIGLTAPTNVYARLFKIDARQPTDVLPEVIAQAREAGAQTILLLSHLASNNDRPLAEQVPGIDVIVGGHDHKKIYPPEIVNGTIIVQAGEFGQHLGRLDLNIDPLTGKIDDYHGELIPVEDDIPEDAQALAAVQAERERAQRMMQVPVGVLAGPLELFEDRECAAGNLLADALLERIPGAQIALCLAGHWQTGLEAGVVTQGALYAANRSTANPARAGLTGAQVEHFLLEAFKPENAARRLHGLRGRAVGMPHVAGLRVQRDPTTPDALEIWIGDEPLDRERRYVTAATDMEFADSIGYLSLPDEVVEYEVPTIVPEVVEEYIARHSPVEKPLGGRIREHCYI